MAEDPRDTFSGAAERYLDSSDHRSGPDLDRIRSVASDLMPDLTVDVATGAGHATRAAAPFSAFCLVTDLTYEMLVVSRRHLRDAGILHTGFLQASADGLPLAAGSADLVTCRIAGHHFPSIPDFLAEVNRVLSDKGKLVLIDSVVPDDAGADRFLNRIERMRDPSHVRSHTVAGWRGFLTGAGLVIRSEEVFRKRHRFTEWSVRAGLDEAGVRALEREFRQAPADYRRLLDLELGPEGEVLAYTDDKAMFVCSKGGP